MSYTPTTTKKYLDDAGLNYIITNYVIKRQVGTVQGDMIYVSTAESGTIGQTGYTPPEYSKVGGVITNNYVPTVVVTSTATSIQWKQILASIVSYTVPSGSGITGVTDVAGMLDWLYTNARDNPMTTAGDMIYGGTNGTPTRLAGSATNGYVLKYNTSNNAPYWAVENSYGADRGISLVNNNFGHSNTSITAQATSALYPITIDTYGHILSYGNAVTKLPNPNQLNLKVYTMETGAGAQWINNYYDGSQEVTINFDMTDFGITSNIYTTPKTIYLRNRLDSTQFTNSATSGDTPGTSSLNTITTSDIDSMFS